MRTSIIAGNWKMYKDLAETTALVNELKAALAGAQTRAKVVVCPPFTSLPTAASLLAGSPIGLGAQNMSQHDEGAYTGEISWKMLRSSGCGYVILGHSERRQYFGETNATVNLRVKKALSEGLKVIMCVGETLEERDAGVTGALVSSQVREGLEGIDDISGIVIAYEPVWAIGTGKTASAAQAEEVHDLIRTVLVKFYGESVAAEMRIQYGGSVKPSNAAELFAMPNIDGGLIGGASLNAADFAAIIKAAV